MSQNFTIEMFLAAKYGKDIYNKYTSTHLRSVLCNIDHGLSEKYVKRLSRKTILQALSEHFPVNIELYIRTTFERIEKLTEFPQIDNYYDLYYKFDKDKIKKISELDQKTYMDFPKLYKRANEEEKEVFHHLRMIGRYINSLLELRIEMEY